MSQDFVTQIINSWDPIDLLAISPDDEYEVEIFLINQAVKTTDDTNNLAEKIQKIFIKAFSDEVFKKTFADCLDVAERLLKEKRRKDTYTESVNIESDVQLHTLTNNEIEVLLQQKIPAFLATHDLAGFPRITRLYFLWEEGVLYLASLAWKPYLQDIIHDSEVEVSIDTRDLNSQNKRKYSQIVITGIAKIEKLKNEKWHRKILNKYLDVQLVDQIINSKVPHVLVLITPKKMKGFDVRSS